MTPNIKTLRLTLLPPFIHEGMDVRHYLRWLENKEVMQYSENRHHTHTRETQYEYLCSFDQENDHLWDIILAGNPIGSISAHLDIPNRTANVGIMIGNENCWHKGYGLEAWNAACKWLFSQDTRKIEGGCMACNQGMIRIFEKAKFDLEATIPGHFLLKGKPVDKVLYGKTQKAKVIHLTAGANHSSRVLGSTGDAA